MVQPPTSPYRHRATHAGGRAFRSRRAEATERAVVLGQARAQHPERFGTAGIPKILDLPTDAWINKPSAEPDADQAAA